MGSSSTFDGSDTTLLLDSDNLHCASQVLDSFWMSSSSPSFQDDLLKGSASMVDFQNPPQDNGKNGRFFSSLDIDEDNSEAFDPCFHRSEKKRRLGKDQVQFLEKSFEKDNKLEPDRKVQLAKEIGLQPRQVAVWYQNRRARYKSKQLEKDYDVLKASYDKLEVDYDNLLKQNGSLRNEVESLKEKILVGEKRKAGLEPMNPLDEEAKPTENLIVQNENNLQVMVCKQEYVNSSDSHALDSPESLYSADGNLKSVFESVDSSSAFEPDYSDFSQDGDDGFSRMMLLPDLPMLETECFDDIYVDHSNLENSVEDQHLLLWNNVFDV